MPASIFVNVLLLLQTSMMVIVVFLPFIVRVYFLCGNILDAQMLQTSLKVVKMLTFICYFVILVLARVSHCKYFLKVNKMNVPFYSVPN